MRILRIGRMLTGGLKHQANSHRRLRGTPQSPEVAHFDGARNRGPFSEPLSIAGSLQTLMFCTCAFHPLGSGSGVF